MGLGELGAARLGGLLAVFVVGLASGGDEANAVAFWMVLLSAQVPENLAVMKYGAALLLLP
ncbi:hypothetical protein D3C71_1353810 [compost metagenome]